MDTATAAYLAGLFDGEGSVYINGERTLRVSVSNQNKALCEAFLVFGGSVQSGGRIGPKKGGGYRRACWQWVGHRKAAKRLHEACGAFIRQKHVGPHLRTGK